MSSINIKETVFNCEFCNKTFSTSYNLKNHKNTAKFCLQLQNKEIENSFICDFCNKGFTTKIHHSTHVSTCKVKKEIEEKELEKEMREMISRQTISSTMEYIEITKGKIGLEAKSPKFPYPKPHPYQIEAYNNWCNNDFNGLFAMATGTGKTLTALYCLIEEIKKGNNQRNIIVVPGKELVEQWYSEMLECGFNPPVKWYSENGKLNREIDFIKSQLPSHSSELNIITTYSSFSSQKFISTIGNAFSDFTLVFDEAHNMGAPGFMSAIRGLSLNRKIGLSATPLRLWD
jgi:superfamily II DNA or RNA helicase